MNPDSTILIGNKPFMNYVTAVTMQFQEKGEKEVILKARGKFISKAVDVAEVSRRRFLDNVSVSNIQISTEEYEKEGKKTNISAIAITLSR